jgi:sugar/nucleoside kinase (ribokinase family)
MYDVLCYGALCADLRLLLPRVPRPGEGVHVREARWLAGGNALNEARALAGWGARVALLGDTLGHDQAGELLGGELERLGLAEHIARDPAAQTPVCHIMVTPDGQRTILALRGPTPPLRPPPAALLAASRLVSVTRFGPHTAAIAALAAAAGRPVLAGDALRPDDPLAAHADVIVTSAELLAAQGAGGPIERQMAGLHARRGAAIVVTDGPRPVRAIWREAGELRQLKLSPPTVAPGDTTGAGDTFRAGVAWGVAQGWAWSRAIEFACAAAARQIGAQ